MTIKVTREGKEIEIEEVDKLESDVPVTNQDKKGITFTDEQQTHINSLLAAERRKLTKKYEDLSTEFTSYKNEIDTKTKAEEAKLKTQVDELRKGVPETVVKLLDKLTVYEQYEWLNDPENKTEKPILPRTPKEGDSSSSTPKRLGTII